MNKKQRKSSVEVKEKRKVKSPFAFKKEITFSEVKPFFMHLCCQQESLATKINFVILASSHMFLKKKLMKRVFHVPLFFIDLRQ
jgi:hypothetical protein